MSTKKTKANGALQAPASSIVSSEKTLAVSSKKTNGKPANGKISNGKNGKSTAIYENGHSYDEGIDSKFLLKVLAEVRSGNFSVRMPNDGIGLPGKIYDTLNEVITLNEILVK